MPESTTHRQGCWLGGGTEVDLLIEKPCLECFPGLQERLREAREMIRTRYTDEAQCSGEVATACAVDRR